MIRDLYDYAVAHPEIVQPSGYQEAGIDVVVCVSMDGHIKDVQSYEKSMKFMRPVRNGARNDDPFVRKVEALCDSASTKLQSLVLEFNSCNDQMLDGVRLLLGQNLNELIDAVSGLIQTSLGELEGKERDNLCRKLEKQNVGFSVLDSYGVEHYVWDLDDVRNWWAGVYSEENRTDRLCIDMLTGETCYASKLIKNTSVKAAGGGQTSGSNLISFNGGAFESYGFVQGANMPAGMRSVSMAIDAYNHLALNGVRLADMRLLCWCSGLEQEQSELFDDIFRFDFGQSEKDASQDDLDAASRRIRDILAAPVDARMYGSLEKGTYHVMLTKADAARISVLYYATGDCAGLLRNYRRWHEAMSVNGLSGAPMKQRNAYGLIFASISLRDRKASDMFSKYRKFVKPLVQACMQGAPIPDDMLSMAVRAFYSAFHPPGDDKIDIRNFGGTVQLLSLCLNIGREEAEIMPNINLENRSVAYLCGRLFAVHEWFYGVATKNSGVMTEKFVACCQKPAAQIKKIQMLCAHRMRDVHWIVGKKFFQSEAEAIFGMLDDIPTGLSMKQQAEFILGYWHEKGRITQVLDKSAENNNQEENNND